MQFFYLVEIANRAPEGDYVELGTFKGYTARLIYRLMDQSRRLYLLDTYEGFDERDLPVEKKLYANDWHAGNFEPTSPEAVTAYVGGGSPPANVVPIKGWFPDSFKGLEDHRWRFVHIDLDLYQPILTACDMLWPRLVPGGVMLIHDYGCYGFRANLAVDEFAAKIGQVPVPLADRWGSVAIIKPRFPYEG